MSDNTDLTPAGTEVSRIADELSESIGSDRARVLKKFALAAVGAIPWVGGFLVALVEISSKDFHTDSLQQQWLEEHAKKFEQLQQTLNLIAKRLESFDDRINPRIESPEFLALVGQGFRAWDTASTDEKRDYVRRLLANAAASDLCSDDLVRLFISWIEQYDETHFKIIRAIYNHDGITRREIWSSIHKSIPRDDSQEADLFKLLIHDLSLGHVIRQERATTHDGRFIKKRPAERRPASSTVKSPFDGNEGYELTDLGRSFVHYVMNEVAPQLGHKQPQV